MNQLIGTIRFPNLNIVLEHVGKEITILGFSIHFYGIIIALGFLAGLAMAMHEAKRTEQNPEDYLDYMLWMVIPAIIGARLYYVIFSWEDYKDNLLSIFAVRQGGLAIYGTIRFPNLNIVLEHVGKEITILGFSIHFYGIIIALGFLAGLAMAMHEAKRTEQNPEDYLDYMLWMVIPAIIGARLYYVIFSWEDYKDNLLSIFAVRQGGLAIYGGVIAAVLVLIIFCKIRRKSFFLMADTMVMGLLIGQIMGRWGNFFNREAFGGYTDGLFAMQIPIADASYTTPELLQKAVTIGVIDYIQVQPTFLYEGLWNLAVLLLIFFFWRKKKKFDGELLCVYLAGYGLGRCWIEGMRTDQLLLGSTSIPVSQVLAGVLAIIGISVIVVKRIRMRKTGLSFRK